jgi:hypothetical protein
VRTLIRDERGGGGGRESKTPRRAGRIPKLTVETV